jgi:hypothetical protein
MSLKEVLIILVKSEFIGVGNILKELNGLFMKDED